MTRKQTNKKNFKDMSIDEINLLTKDEWKMLWKHSSNTRLGPKINEVKAEKAYNEYQKLQMMIKLQEQMKQTQE